MMRDDHAIHEINRHNEIFESSRLGILNHEIELDPEQVRLFLREMIDKEIKDLKSYVDEMYNGVSQKSDRLAQTFSFVSSRTSGPSYSLDCLFMANDAIEEAFFEPNLKIKPDEKLIVCPLRAKKDFITEIISRCEVKLGRPMMHLLPE